MKRDWELVREMLLDIEALDKGHHFFPHRIDDHTSDSVSYHLHLLEQAGLVECADHRPLSGELIRIGKALTLTGHDLLDLIRDDAIWQVKKAFLTEHLGGITIDALKNTTMSLYPSDSGSSFSVSRHAQNDAIFN
ncbi:MAG: DUF2513 domain-containing protein [Pseudomonas sp.]